ncbi:hypothetical protein [Rheinheimera aquimaris]|uniref:hypothetical protein n=1 Tax=Rheinheimera aquimaris TaxID=412437 RepID=UPI001E5F1C3F|nr:hypothetical protein [Rheinheimera aquimaris]MCD1596854.1 hypothetical protein [Rheinheimera aquimaris]
MYSNYADKDITVPYEEQVNGFIIYIEDNPDRWRGGYSWSVCKDEVLWHEGLTFTISDAIHSANNAIAVLSSPPLGRQAELID